MVLNWPVLYMEKVKLDPFFMIYLHNFRVSQSEKPNLKEEYLWNFRAVKDLNKTHIAKD